MQPSTVEDFGDSLSSEEDEDMDLLDQEIQSQTVMGSPCSTATSPTGVESVQGNGTFSLVNKQPFFLSMFMFAFMFLGPGKLLFGAKNSMSRSSHVVCHFHRNFYMHFHGFFASYHQTGCHLTEV